MREVKTLDSNKAVADKCLAFAYKEYKDFLYKYCTTHLRYDKNSADDCVQNAYLLYYKKLLSGETIKYPKAFLYKTVSIYVKKAEEQFLKNAKKQTPLADARNLHAPEIDRLAADLDYDVLKALLISELSAEEQELYNMKYVMGMTLKEIAEVLNTTPTAVANRTSRMRAKVKRLVPKTVNDFVKEKK